MQSRTVCEANSPSGSWVNDNSVRQEEGPGFKSADVGVLAVGTAVGTCFSEVFARSVPLEAGLPRVLSALSLHFIFCSDGPC